MKRLIKKSNVNDIVPNRKYYFNDDNKLFMETYIEKNNLIGNFDYNEFVSDNELEKILFNLGITMYNYNNGCFTTKIIENDEYTMDGNLLKTLIK